MSAGTDTSQLIVKVNQRTYRTSTCSCMDLRSELTYIQGLETPKRLNEDVGRFKERIGLICQSWRERRVIEVMVQPLSSSSTRVNRNQTELYDNTQMEGGVQGG